MRPERPPVFDREALPHVGTAQFKEEKMNTSPHGVGPAGVITQSIEIDGKTITFETGKVAKQASGGVVVRCGGTMVLVTAQGAKDPKPGIDFLPLTVDYQEKMSAAGRIPGGFFKREGKARDEETLISRMIDRSGSSALRRRLGLRNAGHRYRVLGRPGRSGGHLGDVRRVAGAVTQRHALPRTNRRRSRLPR